MRWRDHVTRMEVGGCLRQHRLHCSGNEPDVSLLSSPATHPSACAEKGRALSRTLAAQEILSSLLFAPRLYDVSLLWDQLLISYCPPLALPLTKFSIKINVICYFTLSFDWNSDANLVYNLNSFYQIELGYSNLDIRRTSTCTYLDLWYLRIQK